MIDKVGLLSAAYTRLGQQPVSSFDNDTDEGRAAVANYSLIKRAALSQHQWRFALRWHSVDALAGLGSALTDEYDFAFAIPQTVVFVVGLRDDADFDIYHNELYANNNPAVILSVDDVGEENFPPWFADALATQLSLELCYAVTQDLTLRDLLRDEARRKWFMARGRDMQSALPPSMTAALHRAISRDTMARHGNATGLTV